MATTLLGSFLRAHRERVSPADVGLPDQGTRRTPGLRREEVAMLAGISADYYLRLERGRDAHPSTQVLQSLARVLRLDDVHRDHLMAIGGEAPRSPRPAVEEMPPGVLDLVASMSGPAYVEDRFYDVVASNDLARALSPRLAPGGNQLRDLLLDPDEQALHPDWEAITECWVANLRLEVGPDVDDPRFVGLVADLGRSDRFRDAWARQEVKEQGSGWLHLRHPVVGRLLLRRDRLAIAGTPDLSLVVYHPEPGSVTAARLACLAEAATASEGVLAGPRLDGALVAS